MTNSNERIRWTNEQLDQLASFIFANAEAIRENAEVTRENAETIRENAEAIRENAEAIRESNQRMTGLEHLVQSNSRAIQALADRIADLTNDIEDLTELSRQATSERAELRQATLGIANLLASLDEDRPTILRKLNTIEKKVDRLLEQGNSFGDEEQQ